MKTVFINIFNNLGHLLLGPSPDMNDLIRTMVVLVIIFLLFIHLFGKLMVHIMLAWFRRRAQKNLLRAGDRLGFQTRQEGTMFARTAASEGTHRGRSMRFFTCDWRGYPLMAVAAACHEPTGLWLQVRPNSGWLLNVLLNVVSCRLQDLRAEDAWQRAFSTGDSSFDKAYLIKSNQTDRAVGLLNQKIRDQLVTMRRPFRNAPIVTVAKGEVRYALHPGLFSAAVANRLAEKLDFICNLADQVEGRRA